MRVAVSLNHHFRRSPDGALWTHTMFGRSFWDRYLNVFDEVRVVARVAQVQRPPDDWIRADGPGVTFAALPEFTGPSQYLRRRAAVKQALERQEQTDHAQILRIPSIVSSLVWRRLTRSKQPYGVEVVGDPWDGLSPGSFRHPLLPFFRWLYTADQRRQCTQAAGAAYVTREALQQRYPCAGRSTNYSSVELSERAFAQQPRTFAGGHSPVRLVFVGSIDHLKKAPDVLVEAVGRAVAGAGDFELTFVGGGRFQSELAAAAGRQGIAERVRFCGDLTAGEAVRRELDRADLFVLPSRHEGLPRAMIEAMARGLPCIGSTVGGFGELVPGEDLVPPGDATALAEKIDEIARDPVRMTRMSARNLAAAADYRDEVLQQRRTKFYEFLQDRTRDWLAAGRNAGQSAGPPRVARCGASAVETAVTTR